MTHSAESGSNRSICGSLLLACALALAVLGTVPAPGQDLQIGAKPLPGQLDVLQGTAFQLGGTPLDTGPRPSSYRWEILEGEGGELVHPDQPEAIFRAPVLEDKDLVVFVIQLTAEYGGEEPARARLHVRVHKELPEKTADQQTKEDEMAAYIKGLSKRQKRKLAKQYRRQSNSNTTVVHSSPYPSWHFGLYWGWGWPVHYPIYVPIIVPPPGGEWEPGEGNWLEPTPVPYDEIVSSFPEEIANDYLPQDFPLADEITEIGYLGGGPGDTFDPDFGGDYGGFDDPGLDGGFDDPGFGGGFDDPGMGGGFDDFDGGFDDFGW